MKVPYAMTVQACHQHRRLTPELRARVDKLILGLRLAPTIGLYDKENRQFNAHVAGDLRVTYQLIANPEPQLVIMQIVPMAANWLRELRVPALAGADG